MACFVPTRVHQREALLFCFHLGKSAADSHRMLVEAYGGHALSETTCREWFRRFKANEFDVKDRARPGQPRKFEDGELEALLEEDPCQTLDELAVSLHVDGSTVSKRLKAIGMIQKLGNWVPHDLREGDIVRRATICEMLLQRHRRKSFLHRIVTGDEKWIRHDNPKCRKSWVRPGEPSTSTPKPDIHGRKVLLCIWWDQVGIVHYELLQPGQTINAERYRQQLLDVGRALTDKRPQYAGRHDKVVLLHDNARPHVAGRVKEALADLGWDVLPHPPYSPDVAPSDYHLFRSMQHGLSGQRFQSVEGIQNWLDEWIASREPGFFRRGIRELPDRWERVVATGGHYFE